MKEIYIDGTLKTLDTTQWYPAVMRKDYVVGVTVSENGLDDPDQQFYENFACGAERNYTGYCSAEVDRLIDQLPGRAWDQAPPAERLRELTGREREVLALVGQGLTNDEIAKHLVMSPATAKTHVYRAMTKLRARHRAELVVLAYETGLAPPAVPAVDPARRLVVVT